ncbi:hypothetical protein PAI11_22210 [Patulibacter medicamentivorans]|uniref:Rad50/SbcC-type AAA domain-containing protein n=1 Tax=Patulibacter medicamentivorans TaxID=1097667 RepID=H0E5X0_9ACTN|nr:hypothetical protein [Patulibacter medicamentivorans]EHN10911.1 hypothetical protein PAI11_22210 [Patulibacter medicamentivorans]
MSLRLRALRLVAHTEDGAFGRDLRFGDGLIVLRAENSMGKTTAINSILYAMGMEGLITERHAVPLTAAMTQQLQAPDGRVLNVSESVVSLQIENDRGQVATLERYAKRQTGDTRTIRAWDAPRLTAPTPDDTFRDMLARVQGSGVGQMAIGQWLEQFIGWELPVIVMPDGTERRLYPELIMALMFVEQRGGWGGIQAAMPTYGIPDVRKRAREYILGLTVYERQRRRLELRRALEELKRDWTATVRAAESQLGAVGIRLQAPADIDPDFGADSPLQAFDLRSSRPLPEELSSVRNELAQLSDAADTDRSDATLSIDEARLRTLESQLQNAMFDVRQRERDLQRLRREQADLAEQTDRLDEDLVRNKDAQRLQGFGGEPWTDDDRDCPTCHQVLPPTLLGTLDRPTMTVEQNIAYIEQQKEVVRAAQDRAAAEIQRTFEVQTAARQAIADTRAEVRALRDALVRARGVPSAADVQRRLNLERRIESLAAAEIELGVLRDTLTDVAARAAANRAEMTALPSATFTPADEARIARLQEVFLDQLGFYHPESLPLGDLEISRDSYLPAAGNVDLGFQISASDGIRLIWAYLLGLLETSRTVATPHPGLLIFDEPRQQSAKERSLEMLLQRAARAREYGEQVLFATSEPRANLDAMLADIDVQYEPIDGRLLIPRN